MSLQQQLFLRQQLNDGGSLGDIGGGQSLFGITGGFLAGRTNFGAPSEFMMRYQQWYMSYHGEQLRVPRFNKSDLDLEQLWFAVKSRGGSSQVSLHKQWAEIGRLFDPPSSMTNLSFHIKRLYEKYLLAYEKTISPQSAMDWRYAPVNPHANEQQSFVASSVAEEALRPLPPSSPRSPPHKKQAHDYTVQENSNQSNLNLNSNQAKMNLNSNQSKKQAYDYTVQENSNQSNMNLNQNQANMNLNSNYSNLNLNLNLGNVDNLVGSIIRLFVADRGDYCPAIVTGFDSQLSVHTVRLQDGSIRDVQLADCLWQKVVMNSGKESINTNPPSNDSNNSNDVNSNNHNNNFSSSGLNQVRQFLLSNSVSFDTAPAEFNQPRIVHFDKEEERSRCEAKIASNNNNNDNKPNVVSGRNTPPEEKSQNMASSFAPLVYKLQTQLQSALSKIKQLEIREEQRVQEMQQMHATFVSKERQLHALVSEMRLQLREAQEGKQTAEGAVQELRNCFSLLVNTQGIPTSAFP